MASENAFWPPKHLASQPRAVQIGTLLIGPIVAGAICGWLLGESKTAYTIATLVLILGGLAAGYEHDTLIGGALRGLWGGALFGATIVATHAIIGAEPKAETAHPMIIIAVVFGLISAVLGVIGAAIKRRHVRSAGTRAAT